MNKYLKVIYSQGYTSVHFFLIYSTESQSLEI